MVGPREPSPGPPAAQSPAPVLHWPGLPVHPARASAPQLTAAPENFRGTQCATRSNASTATSTARSATTAPASRAPLSAPWRAPRPPAAASAVSGWPPPSPEPRRLPRQAPPFPDAAPDTVGPPNTGKETKRLTD